MDLKRISVGNFKSLYDTSFEPGKINVFIGANGSGKSMTLYESCPCGYALIFSVHLRF